MKEDKSGKPELSKEDIKRFAQWREINNRFDDLDDMQFKIFEYATLHGRSAAQARIAELEDEYKDLKNSIQQFFQVLIARNYNNIGEWHNERQQYNFELIQEIENLLIKHNSRS